MFSKFVELVRIERKIRANAKKWKVEADAIDAIVNAIKEVGLADAPDDWLFNLDETIDAALRLEVENIELHLQRETLLSNR